MAESRGFVFAVSDEVASTLPTQEDIEIIRMIRASEAQSLAEALDDRIMFRSIPITTPRPHYTPCDISDLRPRHPDERS